MYTSVVYFDVLFILPSTQAQERLMNQVRGQLFAGLEDTDKTIRQLLTNFWKDDRRLTGSTFNRLRMIFEIFLNPELQHSFLATACHLVLDLCRRSPSFSQPMFTQSLSDCEFIRQPIEISWKSRGTFAPVTANTFAPTSSVCKFTVQRESLLLFACNLKEFLLTF